MLERRIFVIWKFIHNTVNRVGSFQFIASFHQFSSVPNALICMKCMLTQTSTLRLVQLLLAGLTSRFFISPAGCGSDLAWKQKKMTTIPLATKIDTLEKMILTYRNQTIMKTLTATENSRSIKEISHKSVTCSAVPSASLVLLMLNLMLVW